MNKKDSTQVTSSKDGWTLADLVEFNLLERPTDKDIKKDRHDKN